MTPKIEKLQFTGNYNNVSSNVQPKNVNNTPVPVGKNFSNAEKTGDNYTKTDVDYTQKLEMFLKTQDFESLAELIEFGIDKIDENFGHLSAEEQYNRLLEFCDKTDEESAKEEPVGEEKDFFAHKAFAELSNADKVKTLSLELAKNRFLYADKDAQKTKEDWNALSDEQREQLIQNERSNIVKDGPSGAFCDDAVSDTLEEKMTALQAANSRKMTFEELDSFKPVEKMDIISGYIYEINKSDDPSVRDNLSDKQIEALKEREFRSKIIIEECKNSGIADFPEEPDVLRPSEIRRYSKDIRKETGKDELELQIQYLENKQAKGIPLDESEQEKLEYCQTLQNGLKTVRQDKNINFGRLEAVRNSEYGAYLENSMSTADKITVYSEYIERSFSNLPPEEFAKAVGELTSEIMSEPDGKILAVRLYGSILKNASPEQKKAFARLNDAYSQVNNTVNINEHDLESVIVVAETQEEQGYHELAKLRIKRSDDVHAHATSKVDSASKNEDVQYAHSDRAFGVKDAKMQKDMLTNAASDSSFNVRKDTALRLFEAHKDNQVDLTQKFIADKDVATAMNEAQILDKFHKDNQTEIFTNFKNRFEQDDFSKDQAIIQLNTLSNQIQNCDKDNQLAMHNEIMTSKYSEVQEHAASNIKNYDSSVQAKAMDAVYQTGNQKAIDKAVANMTSYKSEDVKSQELGRVFGEAAIQVADSKDLKERFLEGKLTLQEIAQLPSSQRREYFTEMYKKASPSQKLRWLSKLPDGNQKRSIYTFIALYDKNLLNSMVENGKGYDMFMTCNDPAAQNKIYSVMEKSENNEVKEQCERIKRDPRNASLFIGKNIEKEPRTARTLNSFTSVPQAFSNGVDGLEFFKKQDKFGTFLKA